MPGKSVRLSSRTYCDRKDVSACDELRRLLDKHGGTFVSLKDGKQGEAKAGLIAENSVCEMSWSATRLPKSVSRILPE
jgi:hypothetical protein